MWAMTSSPIRVVIADDHAVVRSGLRLLLTSVPGIEIVGEASTGREAVREAVLSRPDVVVMDLRMPDLDGVEATRSIMKSAPEVAVLVLTMVDDDDTVFAAMRAGARGYLLKGSVQNDVFRAIHAVAGGDVIFGPALAERVLGFFRRPVAETPFPELTPREREVLNLIASGLNNATVATRLGLSGKTVGNHISSIFAKLQVAGRSEAIARAKQHGLGRAGEPV
jgi:DNA-binding NarL/FixJ family response regulator